MHAELGEEICRKGALQKLGILREKAKEYLVDEVGNLLWRMATTAEPSRKLSETCRGFRGDVSAFLDRP